jgi:hypothetical protein
MLCCCEDKIEATLGDGGDAKRVRVGADIEEVGG